MKYLFGGARYLLGLLFLVFGINGLMMFLHGKGFIPMPPPSESMMVIMKGFMATGYLMILVKAIEVLAGLLLIANKFVNLALTLLGPIVVNILGIHIFAEPSGLPMGLGITVLWALLILSRWKDFRFLLRP